MTATDANAAPLSDSEIAAIESTWRNYAAFPPTFSDSSRRDKARIALHAWQTIEPLLASHRAQAARLAEAESVVEKFHRHLERVEELRFCTCGRRTYIGLDHKIGAYPAGCDGCAVLTPPTRAGSPEGVGERG